MSCPDACILHPRKPEGEQKRSSIKTIVFVPKSFSRRSRWTTALTAVKISTQSIHSVWVMDRSSKRDPCTQLSDWECEYPFAPTSKKALLSSTSSITSFVAWFMTVYFSGQMALMLTACDGHFCEQSNKPKKIKWCHQIDYVFWVQCSVLSTSYCSVTTVIGYMRVIFCNWHWSEDYSIYSSCLKLQMQS